jgi:hypothetical protein
MYTFLKGVQKATVGMMTHNMHYISFLFVTENSKMQWTFLTHFKVQPEGVRWDVGTPKKQWIEARTGCCDNEVTEC